MHENRCANYWPEMIYNRVGKSRLHKKNLVIFIYTT